MKRLFRKIKRMLLWAWNLRDDCDWDSGFLFKMEVMKLKKMQKYFLEEGLHDEACPNYKKKMQSLSIAIKIGDALISEKYTDAMFRRKKRQVGYEFIKSKHGDGLYEMVTVWEDEPKIPLTDEEKTAYYADFEKAELIESQRRKLFYKIIAEHGERWWD